MSRRAAVDRAGASDYCTVLQDDPPPEAAGKGRDGCVVLITVILPGASENV